jgi:hypothetical protein
VVLVSRTEPDGLGREFCSRPGASSATKEIQGAVRKPALQLTDDFHRALPDWACHHADFRSGPEEKGAIATGTITLAGILIEPVPARVRDQPPASKKAVYLR